MPTLQPMARFQMDQINVYEHAQASSQREFIRRFLGYSTHVGKAKED